MPKDMEVTVDLISLNIHTFSITLVGDSPLISHAWSKKATDEMAAKQQKKAKGPKEAKNPKKEYEASLYVHPDGGHGFPTVAFKGAAVNACSYVDGITKVEARGAFHINGELVKIKGRPSMRTDMVRIGMGIADIRYRGEFKKWSVTFEIRHNANVLSAEQIINLFNTAGFAVGVGEWRPQKNGSYGMFHVETSK